MDLIWVLFVAMAALALFWVGARAVGGGEGRLRVGGRKAQGELDRDRFPDRTGPQTRRELGAKNPVDRAFTGNRAEGRAPGRGGERVPGGDPVRPRGDETATGVVQTDPARPAVPPGVRREVADGDVTPRPADRPPTQPHPREHGVPGDHQRAGHHRSATAPERMTNATDPFAHAPVPGPNHVPPETGQIQPDEARP